MHEDSQPQPSLPRLTALDGVRGLAIILVLFHHCVCWNNDFMQNMAGANQPLNKVVQFLAEWSNSGVDLFFVLSGFLITRILLQSKPDPRYYVNFYGRRVLRIFPLYYLFLLIIFGILPYFCADPILSTLRSQQGFYWLYLGNVEMIIHPRMGNMFLLHTFSLAIEEQFYMIWPTVIKLVPVGRLPAVLVGLIILSNIIRCVLASLGWAHSNVTFARLDTFSAGALLTLAMPQTLTWQKKLAAIVLLVTIPLLALVSKMHSQFLVWTCGPVIVCLACTSLVFLALDGPAWVARIFGNNILRAFGKYSYSIYLFHFPILYFVRKMFGTDLQAHTSDPLFFWFPILVVVTASSFAVGVMTYYTCERYFLGLKDVFFAPRKLSAELPANLSAT